MERLPEYPNHKFLRVSFFGPKLLLIHINYLSDDVICNIAISADDTTFYSTHTIRCLICGIN